jgi:hypothetical protein
VRSSQLVIWLTNLKRAHLKYVSLRNTLLSLILIRRKMLRFKVKMIVSPWSSNLRFYRLALYAS